MFVLVIQKVAKIMWKGYNHAVATVIIGVMKTMNKEIKVEKMSKKGSVTFAFVILLALTVVMGIPVYAIAWRAEHSFKMETIIKPFPIYRATVPFGTFLINGKIGGSFLFFFGEVSEDETYIIKYLEDRQLKTISCKADRTPLTVEENRFEIVFTLVRKTSYNIFGNKLSEFSNEKWSYEIFIPFLPSGENMTNDWGK